ncbi:hypothetical protein ACQVP2_35105 [Methylobacterium aquaticum]|uniref:hypothetical protein n=1 Tax=Methylobacterium aquaticum TaxID=270351 RepID=UPI003D1654AA
MNAEVRTPHLVGLTALQSRAYAYIWRCIQDGTSPTYDEIALHLGVVSRGNVARMVGCLIERGYVRKRKHSARSLYLAPGAPEPVGPASPASHIAFASPLVADLRAQAQRENREVSALLEDAVALYLRTAA